MRPRNAGPLRTAGVGSYLRETRVLAVLAVAGLVAGAVSDVVGVRFWNDHPLLAGLTANVIVVLLSVAVLNEVIQSRSRRRWRVLAQYVMFELGHNARLIWTGVLEAAELMPSDSSVHASIEGGGRAVRDSARLTAAIRRVVADPERRRGLGEVLSEGARTSDEIVAQWAPVMLSAEVYAEVIDRHVELAGDLAWIKGLVAEYDSAADLRRRRVRFSSAVLPEADVDEQWLADKVATITQLAEKLDRSTFEAGLRVVPVGWWEARLGLSLPSADLRARAARPFWATGWHRRAWAV